MLIAAAVGLLGLAVLAIVSVWGMSAVRQGFDQAADEFDQLRVIAAVEVRVARARGLLAAERPSTKELTKMLDEALGQIAAYRPRSNKRTLVTPAQRERVATLLAEARDHLEIARNRVADWPADTVDADDPILLHAIEKTLDATSGIASITNEAMATAERYTRRQQEETIASMAIVVGLVVFSALLVAVWQYRAVIGPLWRLRRGVRHIAMGRFDMRLVAEGDRDFAELADDFNRMADELQTVYADLEQKVEAKSRELVRSERLASVGHLAAGIAHEINNPLGIIAGHAELSLMQLNKGADGAASEDTRETLEVIRDEAFRCKEIIQQLLSLSRKAPATRSTIDAAETATAVSKMVRGHAEAKDRSVELDFPAERPLWISANPPEIKQVLLNLVVNALQATEPGTGYVDIAGRYDDESDEVVLTVEDNGRGMDRETAERVFEPFYSQSKGGDSFGLGLSVTHAIVDAHGGRISASSPGVGKGARFTVRLPASEAPTQEPETATPQTAMQDDPPE